MPLAPCIQRFVTSNSAIIRLLCGALALAPVVTVGAAERPGPLPRTTVIDDYVKREDPSYSWGVVSSTTEDGTTSIVVDMVSQQWLTKEDVDLPEWRHWLTLAVPAKVTSNVGMLFIGGGRNGRDAPKAAGARFAAIAKATGSVVAELGTVPNQPLTFHNDGKPRTEDDLIGYTWDQFLKTGEARWLARNAMIKSAVRAMDTMTAVMATADAGKRNVDRFVVAGGSKRGWTTWLTGAMDDRVVGIIPIVIDVLNTQVSMQHHFEAYGFWAPSIGNYVEHHIMERLDHPRLAELYKLVDPYHYRHRLNMPKLLLNAAGDQFFLPDSSHFYWDELRGENYLRYIPNTDHGMDGTDVLDTIVAFQTLIVEGRKPPQFTWKRSGDGKIRILTETDPVAVTLWQANNPHARDFRVETMGRKYTQQAVKPNAEGLYEAHIDTPKDGWTAWFVELTFDVGAATPLKLTTNVAVAPDVLPFKGKPANLPPSITYVCTPKSDADVLASQVVAQLEGQPFAANLHARVHADRLYLNWTPAAGLYDGAGGVDKQLQAMGCTNSAWQLESGPDITLPPVSAR